MPFLPRKKWTSRDVGVDVSDLVFPLTERFTERFTNRLEPFEHRVPICGEGYIEGIICALNPPLLPPKEGWVSCVGGNTLLSASVCEVPERKP